ncbi:MAG TPA: (Fe-S)-binding protein [Actinomycetota bacterium]|nr:(Fe-S)-binding protein [Actinomycetota bacterium]
MPGREAEGTGRPDLGGADGSNPGGAGGAILGAELPRGVRFVGPEEAAVPRWPLPDAPADDDIATCVACGLCLPHCPTYRLTGDETASPRGRIAAMRAVAEGRADVDLAFRSYMDLCLACRACEDVCPSHVPFGRMIERARVQAEPLQPLGVRALKRLGLEVVLPRPRLVALATAIAPLARPFLPRRLRALLPRARPGTRLPRSVEPAGEPRGTAWLLTGCVQDRWFREVHRATIRVLARNGWRVVVPRGQVCCGALAAHHGRLGAARRMARRNLAAFAGAELVVANAAGCGAHLAAYGELAGEEGEALAGRVRDVLELLHEGGIEPPRANPGVARVAYHDACHALRAQKIRAQPRALLSTIPGLEVLEVPEGDRCCGAAGLYNVLQPRMADELMRRKAEAIASVRPDAVASANPGCTIQIRAGLRALGVEVPVLHPIELLDRAYRAAG